MRLLDAALGAGYDSLSIVGMAKNSGKTVTLNHLIDDAFAAGLTLGLTSIGRDGESLDLVTKTDKPTIYVYEGTLIATAQSLFDLGTASLEIVHMSNEHTAMGRIVVARVRHEGFVQLAGPATTAGVARVKALLLGLGAKLVLVDGALDRTSLASPAVTAATVLATGAVLSRDMGQVLAKTAHKVRLLGAARVGGSGAGSGAGAGADLGGVLAAMAQAVASRQVGLCWGRGPGGGGGLVQWLDLKTALGAGKRIAGALTTAEQEAAACATAATATAEAPTATAYVLLPGSLVASLVHDFLAVRGSLKGIVWLVQDATKVFLEERDYLQLRRYGFEFAVVEPIRLLGVTVNPVAPAGYGFEPVAFKAAMTSKLEDVPVFDVYQEEAAWTF